MNEPMRPSGPPAGSPADEDSHVQRRSPSGETPALRQRFSSAPGELNSHERLERKLRHAKQLLSELPAGDERARLLSVAVLRRDEALLDGVLAELGRDDVG
ncbi:MAG TPA: hypothetical protein VGP93_17775 [Polyangiaceae bacterium]|nr:hypothetical protein [Polyangiaceae bacterium]